MQRIDFVSLNNVQEGMMKKCEKKRVVKKDVLGIRKVKKPVLRKLIVGGIAVAISLAPHIAFGCSAK